MKYLVLFLFLFTLFSSSSAQTGNFQPAPDFLYGTWTDTAYSENGDGFMFSPDSCLSFITDGEPTGCINEKQNLKVHFRNNTDANPKEIDILLINLQADTIIAIIPMIYEIIDINHIKLATYQTKSKTRPPDFSPREGVEIALADKVYEKQEATFEGR
ncbi:MAG: hypothetical protein IPH84_17420 [Bacteroidales bacterium]|nr:hypothetical protein [Bacteroidales bacterium]